MSISLRLDTALHRNISEFFYVKRFFFFFFFFFNHPVPLQSFRQLKMGTLPCWTAVAASLQIMEYSMYTTYTTRFNC
ncbi:hypothetical protein C0J52_14186 [Blattella germanica]|nr:hypothetical protein C0J52_14186 [Blattella germanica]